MNTFGAAWLTLAIAFGCHVIDEAATDFLAWYNPTAQRIRSYLGGTVPSVFTSGLASRMLTVTAFAGLAPLAYAHVVAVPVAIALP